ncbi:hypothetical protein SAMN02745823_02497 [Sporobacter termitidis DSM 10068]|uniref:Uncharacterized protein n=1 Tax=Sporobacter termitidis DSM 10068 TaxID=1123282 RepID=A0A1M5YGJ1_9FIRM|nr:hypothetical protein [Sporobacter termitidis]SHI10978.1 hypothetical protein SAMN02745823_02497 [Sporobacter termitidis DSM 10068]
MDIEKISDMLGIIAVTLDKTADEVPDEISARENLYFRMKDAAREARLICKSLTDEN